MIYELMALLVPFVAGSALMHAQGVRGWALPAIGLMAGLALQVAIGFLVIGSGLPFTTWLTMSLTLMLPVAWWVHRRVRDPGLSFSVGRAALALLLFSLAVAFLWYANLVKWHTDSFRYLLIASLISNEHLDVLVLHHLSKRLLGISILHAPAWLSGEAYLRALTPLMALSCLMTLAWFSLRGLEKKLPRASVIAFSVAGVLVLASTNRFVWQSFYLNGHLFFGTLLLMVAGCAWLQGRQIVCERVLLTLQALAIFAITVTRPEGTIMAGLVLVPALVNERISWRRRACLLVVLGMSTVLWQAYHMWSHYKVGEDIPGYALIFFLIGGIAVLVSPMLGWRTLLPMYRLAPMLIEAGLWLALAVAAYVQPEVFLASVKATFINLFMDGASWGSSLVLVAVLVLAVIVLTRDPERLPLRFVVTTFLPASFLLAHLREGSYRVGDGDSLSRMFMHILPLAVLFLVSAACAEWRGRKLGERMWNRVESRA